MKFKTGPLVWWISIFLMISTCTVYILSNYLSSFLEMPPSGWRIKIKFHCCIKLILTSATTDATTCTLHVKHWWLNSLVCVSHWSLNLLEQGGSGQLHEILLHQLWWKWCHDSHYDLRSIIKTKNKPAKKKLQSNVSQVKKACMPKFNYFLALPK